MKVILTPETEDAMLAEVQKRLTNGELRIYSASDAHIATVSVTETQLNAGEISAQFARDQLAFGSGNATWARAYAQDGTAIFDCDIGDLEGDAAIRLNTIRIRTGGPVVLNSFTFGVRR
jgi:hypothetical protein